VAWSSSLSLFVWEKDGAILLPGRERERERERERDRSGLTLEPQHLLFGGPKTLKRTLLQNNIYAPQPFFELLLKIYFWIPGVV
jgi:hypothetical protein